MAKAIKEYGRRVVKGFEVFEVGQKQFMSFGSWNPFNGGVNIYKKAKGLWIVMSCGTTFGGKRYGSRVRVVEECKTLKEAVDSCKVCTDILSYTAGKAHTRYDGTVRHTPSIAYDYEIWHIVDDGDLWQEWDIEAAAAGGDLQAAQMWADTFYDDKYLRQIEDQYKGDYYVYDTTVGDWPGACIGVVSQHDLTEVGYKYVYEHWDEGGHLLSQHVEGPQLAAITCGWYRNKGWRVVSSDVTSIGTWDSLEVLRDDGTAPVWCPLRVCFVCWSEEG